MAPRGPRADAARNTPDRALVKQLAAGSESACRELLARYRSIVYATAYAALVEPEEAEAILTRTFEHARRTALRFLGTHCSVSGWLTHLARLNVTAKTPSL
jgi:DNA-directed RNA polymerase specialized sigma24 family protein